MTQRLLGCHTPGCDTDTARTATLPGESGHQPEGVSQLQRCHPVTAIWPSRFLYLEGFEGWGRGVTGVTGGKRPIVRVDAHCAHTHPHARADEGSPDTRDTRDTPVVVGVNQGSHTLNTPELPSRGGTAEVVTPRDTWGPIADTQLTSMTRHTTTDTDGPAHEQIDATGGGEAA